MNIVNTIIAMIPLTSYRTEGDISDLITDLLPPQTALLTEVNIISPIFIILVLKDLSDL